MYRGLVIDESLGPCGRPKWLNRHVHSTHQHLLDGKTSIKVLEVLIEASEIESVALALSQCLLPRQFYIHFVGSSNMFIVFPKCVCVVDREDQSTAEQCRRIGEVFGIPAEQMQFERLFDHDHPNDWINR